MKKTKFNPQLRHTTQFKIETKNHPPTYLYHRIRMITTTRTAILIQYQVHM